jgi:hypothetical protein
VHTKRCQISAFFSNCPTGENFLENYIRIIDRIHMYTKFFGISDCFFTGDGGKFPSPLREEIWDISEGGISPSLERKKKHCQRLASLVKFFLPKLALLAKSLCASGLLARQKVSASGSPLAVFAHMCAVCWLTPPLFVSLGKVHVPVNCKCKRKTIINQEFRTGSKFG